MSKSTFILNKLVRDKIAAIMKESGITVNTTTHHGIDLQRALQDKLVEEAQEVASAQSIDELKQEIADVLEVLDILIKHLNIDLTEVEKIRQAKNKARGSFISGTYITTIEVDDQHEHLAHYKAKYKSK